MSESYQTNAPLIGDSTRILEAKILNVLRGSSGGGGGGGASSPQTYAATAGTNPTGILAARASSDIAINTTDGSIYWYYNGSWNP